MESEKITRKGRAMWCVTLVPAWPSRIYAPSRSWNQGSFPISWMDMYAVIWIYRNSQITHSKANSHTNRLVSYIWGIHTRSYGDSPGENGKYGFRLPKWVVIRGIRWVLSDRRCEHWSRSSYHARCIYKSHQWMCGSRQLQGSKEIRYLRRNLLFVLQEVFPLGTQHIVLQAGIMSPWRALNRLQNRPHQHRETRYTQSASLDDVKAREEPRRKSYQHLQDGEQRSQNARIFYPSSGNVISSGGWGNVFHYSPWTGVNHNLLHWSWPVRVCHQARETTSHFHDWLSWLVVTTGRHDWWWWQVFEWESFLITSHHHQCVYGAAIVHRAEADTCRTLTNGP